MAVFTFDAPYIYRDKGNKKWLIRYTIKGDGIKNPYRKETGVNYESKFNYIKNLKEREIEINVVLGLVLQDLQDGVDPENRKEDRKKIILQKIKDAEQFHFDYCLNIFMKEKGYVNPIPKKEGSAKTYRLFLNNFLKPVLIENNIVNDVRKLTKDHVQGLIDSHYYAEEGSGIRKWVGNTCNINIAFISSFLEVLIDKKILKENVTSTIKAKPVGGKVEARSLIFKREEINILFNYAQKTDPTLECIYKFIYYGYVRISELFRVKLKDIDLQKDLLNIPYENAKRQNDGYSRDIYIYPKLKECLERYLQITFGDDRRDDYYLFPNLLFNDKTHKKTPVPFYTASAKLYTAVTLLPESKGLFKREGLYPYTLKHSGCTYFIEDNINDSSPTKLLLHLQKQMRHQNLDTTQIYISKDLGINLEVEKSFIYN